MTSGTTTVAREPLVGYNHNIRYQASLYHVQTEDSGLERPHILTHLFLDGMIVASLRTDYRELAADPDSEDEVRKMMQDQHKQIMKMLRRGEVDQRIAELQETLQAIPSAEPAAEPPAEPSKPIVKPEPSLMPEVVQVPDDDSVGRRVGGGTLVDFPPVLDAQLKAAIAQLDQEQKQEQQAQQEQQEPGKQEQQEQQEPEKQEQKQQEQQQQGLEWVPTEAPPKPLPSGIDLPDTAPESMELEPLAEAAQKVAPVVALSVTLNPPPERIVNRQEAHSIRRGQAISREIQIPAELKQQLEVGQRIDLDHPAFSAFPMLEWEGSDDEALELDLEAINNLDLDAEPRRLDSKQLQAIELELEMPPELLPPAEREAKEARVAKGPKKSPSWGEEVDLGEPDEFELMLTPTGPIPILRLPTPQDPGKQLTPLPSLPKENQRRKPSLPPVQAQQPPLKVKPVGPAPIKRAASPAPEQVDDPPSDRAPARKRPKSDKAPARPAPVAPRLMKRPSLPVIPLNKLVRVEPEVGKQRSDPTSGEKPSTRAKAKQPGKDAPHDKPDDKQ